MAYERALCFLATLATALHADLLVKGTVNAAFDRDALNSMLQNRLQDIIGAESPDVLDLKLGRRLRSRLGIPQYMLDLYEAQRRLAQREADELAIDHHQVLTRKPVDTVRTYLHSQRADEALYGMNRIRYQFNVTHEDIPAHERLVGAELRLYRPRLADADYDDSPQVVQVYDIVRPATRRQPDAILRLLDTRRLAAPPSSGGSDGLKGSWLGLDVVEAVQRWRTERNHGLYVQVFRETANATLPVESPLLLLKDAPSRPGATPWPNVQPTLLTFYASSAVPLVRTRRAAQRYQRKKSYNRQREQCRRHSMHINFAEVGWNDWIVAPREYDAFYCRGVCPYPIPEHMNGTNHAVVQSLVNSVRSHGSGVPRACCVPTSLSAISMLYVDAYERVVLKNYQDMVVLGCGCR